MKDIFTSNDELIKRFKELFEKEAESKLDSYEEILLRNLRQHLEGRLEVFKAWKDSLTYKEKRIGLSILEGELVYLLSSQIKKIEKCLK